MPEPVTLAEAKAQTNMVYDDSQDGFLTSLIAPARAYVENISRWSWVQGTRTELFKLWDGRVEIWRQPLISIQNIDGLDPIEVTWNNENVLYTGELILFYEPLVIGQGLPLRITTTPNPTGSISVTYTTGALDPGSEEYLIGKQAMLMLIGHWFENRESVITGSGAASAEVQLATNNLLDAIRPISGY